MVVVGDRICLGPLRKDLLSVYLKWFNDPRVNCYLDSWGTVLTMEDEEDWYDNVRPSDRILTVYLREGLVPIGNAGLHRVSLQHLTAEMGLVLGEREYWGQGLGSEAVKLVLDYGFTGLGLESIHLRVYPFNQRALRCYQGAGLKPAGRLRRAHRIAGRVYDVILMDILASEFDSPVLGALLEESGVSEDPRHVGGEGEIEE